MAHQIDICMTCRIIVHGNSHGGHTRKHKNKDEAFEYVSLGRCGSIGNGSYCKMRPATEEEYQKAVQERARLEQKCSVCGHEQNLHYEARQHRGKYGGFETTPADCIGCWDAKSGPTSLYQHKFKAV